MKMLFMANFVSFGINLSTQLFLKSDHRFVEDPEYGKLVERFYNSTVTKEDMTLINSCLINDHKGNGGIIDLPNDDTPYMYYACETNTEKIPLQQVFLEIT